MNSKNIFIKQSEHRLNSTLLMTFSWFVDVNLKEPQYIVLPLSLNISNKDGFPNLN